MPDLPLEDTFDALADAEIALTNEEPAVETLIVAATTGEVTAILEPDLPDEALGQLFELDPSAIEDGPLHYDRASQRWH